MARHYERVMINEVSYMVCAECRKPHQPGYRACYTVPQPGNPHPANSVGQSLCRACYWNQWKRIYPTEALPEIPDTTPEWAEPLPWQGLHLEGTPEEIAAEKKAIDIEQLEALLAKRKRETEETERMLSELTSVVYRE